MKKIILTCGAALMALQLQAQDTTEITDTTETSQVQDTTETKTTKNNYHRYLHNIDVAVGGGLHSVQFDPKQGGDQDPLFGGTVNIHYRIAPFDRVSFATGIDLTTYRAESQYDELNQTQTRIDPENGYNETYNVKFKDWSEVQNSINLEIPIGVYYRIPLKNVWSLVAGGGFKVEVPISKRYKTRNDKTDGYIDRTAYFEETNVDYSDMPQHALFKTSEYKGSAKMKSAGMAVFVDLGATRPLKENRSLYLGAYFSHSIMNSNKGNNQLYNANNDNYSGVVSSDLVKKSHLMAAGVKVGLSFGFPKVDSAAIKAAQLAEEEARLARERAIADSIAAEEAEAARLARERFVADSIANAQKLAEEKAAEEVKVQEAVAYINKNIRVNFALGKADIQSNPEVEENIAFIVNYLSKNSERVLVIYGHTCDLGKPEKNVALSKRRAEAMKTVLIERGCNPNNIETVGKGPYEPLVPNTSEANRKKNRRIEIQIETHKVE